MVYYGLGVNVGGLSGDLMMMIMMTTMMMVMMMMMISSGLWSVWCTMGWASTWAVSQGTSTSTSCTPTSPRRFPTFSVSSSSSASGDVPCTASPCSSVGEPVSPSFSPLSTETKVSSSESWWAGPAYSRESLWVACIGLPCFGEGGGGERSVVIIFSGLYGDESES